MFFEILAGRIWYAERLDPGFLHVETGFEKF